MKNHKLAVPFLLAAGLLCPTATFAQEPKSPTEAQLAYFPTQMGKKSLYIAFYASREHKERKILERTYWDEVVETRVIHGFRVVVIRSSVGSLSLAEGKWVYGEPDEIERESIYVISSKGVDLHAVFSVASEKDEDYVEKRGKMLDSLAWESRDTFIEEMQNWILPFPVKPGLKRRWPVDDDTYYKVLRGGDRRFLNKAFKRKAFGVAGFISGNWGMTRWFVPGKGMVLYETHNNDPISDTDKFPYMLKALAVYAQ